MQFTSGWTTAVRWALAALLAACLMAQDAPPAQGGGRRGGGRGGFIPGEQRPTGDPAAIARGKTLYGIQCTSCHGADLRGGDMGGPNLLRSQAVLGDLDGEKIVSILQSGRPDQGMPAIAISPDDMKAVAAYLRSAALGIRVQGMPPSIGVPAPSVLVGDARAGQAYFDARCASCHSATGDLKGIAARISDSMALQNTWVAGGGRGGRRGAAQDAPSPRTVIATVTLPSGEIVNGRLIHADDFTITVGLEDGTARSFRRRGAEPKVEVHDPLKPHRDLLAVYTDQDIHNVTAYLATLK